jgi:hypothetical protein
MAGGKSEAYGAAPIGQARPRSAASAELLAAAGEAAVTEIHWKGALARAERAGKAPARLGLVLSWAPPDGHSRRARDGARPPKALPRSPHSQGAMAAGGQAGNLQGAFLSTSDRGSAAAVAGRVQAEVQTPPKLTMKFAPKTYWREIV